MNLSLNDSEKEKNIDKNPFSNISKFWLIVLPLMSVLSVFAFLNFIATLLRSAFDLTNFSPQGANGLTFILLFNIILDVLGIIFLIFLIKKKVLPINKQEKNSHFGLGLTLQAYVMIMTIFTGLIIILFIFWEIISPGNSTGASPYDVIILSEVTFNLINVISLIVLVVILAPIFEELVFRRLLIPLFEGTGIFSSGLAIIASATMFGLIHTENDLLAGSVQFAITHFLTTSLIGIALGVIYVLTRDIRYPILLHAINNGYAIFAQLAIVVEPDINNPGQLTIALTSIFLIILILGIIFIIKSLFELNNYWEPIKQQFKGSNINFSKKVLVILGLLTIEGSLFVFIPLVENFINNSIFPDVIVINFVVSFFLATFVLGICLFVLLHFRETLAYIGNISNPKINLTPNYDSNYKLQGKLNQTVSNNIQTQYNSTYQIETKYCGECGHGFPVENRILLNFCPNCGSRIKLEDYGPSVNNLT